MRIAISGVATVLAVSLSGAPAVADPAGPEAAQPADVCLEVASGAVTDDEWAAVVAAVSETVDTRSALFPDPLLGGEATRLDVQSGHLAEERGGVPCLGSGAQWGAHFGRAFLEAGADQMLAEAPTTPGIDSDVTLDWYPEEARVRTTLVFAGPLDIPNGTCWIDDALGVDATSGTVVASGEQGLETSPFAEGACGRFFDHLPDGGAGEQAVTLLPVEVALADGGVLRFVADEVVVSEHAISMAGRLERD